MYVIGIVVHSGQANGGHYYSFIQHKSSGDEEEHRTDASDSTINTENENNWYKFDDGDVSEFKMDDDELRNQCFGGDYTGEVYDNIMKRMAYKKQKRWWNAYILFYERIALGPRGAQKQTNQSGEAAIAKKPRPHTSSFVEELKHVKIPAYILKSVHKKNIKFLHHRHHFSVEYFQFMKRLCQANLFICQSESPAV